LIAYHDYGSRFKQQPKRLNWCRRAVILSPRVILMLALDSKVVRALRRHLNKNKAGVDRLLKKIEKERRIHA
jgi:hypothetical protein